ncbi:MAG: TIGR03560 family F420-dependent LLM class oxidoreductase [Chloroflexi bacterium]|nr:MAG: TIGR03560 family F420-dependent LLM class oxidoreductase [Chloroflexota bacterium]
MKFGLQVPSFSYPGGTPDIAPTLERIVRTADEVGFDSIWVMDHLFQIRSVGAVDEPMLEGWTALGWIGAMTKRARIGLMVGGIPYRLPAIWVKAATTLDVLTGGRAWLGLGAAWNQQESDALGIPFPPLGVRFQQLEETLRIAHEMFEGETGSQRAFDGREFRATRLLNSPQSISRPRVPIMIGGGGERKTLRLVAQYADASNVFGGPENIHHKWEVLRRHCEAVGRPFEEIERSTLQGVNVSRDGSGGTETPDQVIDRFGELGDAGAQHILFSVRDVWQTDKLELLGSTLLAQLRDA